MSIRLSEDNSWIFWQVTCTCEGQYYKINYKYDRCKLIKISAANKCWSTANYHQSLAFDHPYLSCNDHCDWWLFQEIFFYYYYFQKQSVCRCSSKQVLLEISHYSLENIFISTSSQKRLQHRCFLWKLQFFTNSFFCRTPLVAAFFSLIR